MMNTNNEGVMEKGWGMGMVVGKEYGLEHSKRTRSIQMNQLSATF